MAETIQHKSIVFTKELVWSYMCYIRLLYYVGAACCGGYYHDIGVGGQRIVGDYLSTRNMFLLTNIKGCRLLKQGIAQNSTRITLEPQKFRFIQ